MKELLIIIIIICLKISTSMAQGIIYGSEHSVAYPNYIREIYDHGFIITYDFKPLNKPYSNSALIKVDINGNLLWEKTINNQDEYLQIKGISTTKDNGIIITGRTCLLEENYSDAFIMKLNPCMEVDWCNIYRTPDFDDLADEVVHIPSENSYIISKFSAFQPVHERASLMKIDSIGELIWETSLMTDPDYYAELPLGLEYDTLTSSVVLNGIVGVNKYNQRLGTNQPYLCKISVNGDFMWEFFEIPDTTFTKGFTSRRPMFNENGVFCPVRGSNKSRLLKLNEDGQFQSLNTLYQPDTCVSNVSNSSCKLNDYFYYGLQYFVTGYDAIGNGCIQKTDTLGNFIAETIIPNDFTAIVYDICKTFDNKLLAAATHDMYENDFMLLKYNENLEYDSTYTVPLIYDSYCPEGITSGSIDLTCNIITGMPDMNPNNRSTLKLAPNPAIDHTIIYLPETFSTFEKHNIISVSTALSDYVKDLAITVYDVNSSKVYQSPWPDGVKEQVLKTTRWKSGIYFIRISKGNQTITSGKLMVR